MFNWFIGNLLNWPRPCCWKSNSESSNFYFSTSFFKDMLYERPSSSQHSVCTLISFWQERHFLMYSDAAQRIKLLNEISKLYTTFKPKQSDVRMRMRMKRAILSWKRKEGPIFFNFFFFLLFFCFANILLSCKKPGSQRSKIAFKC